MTCPHCDSDQWIYVESGKYFCNSCEQYFWKEAA